jgi:hypothetical protein
LTTKLFIYNEALGHLGERALASLSEPREPRRVLDSYWDDVVGYALAQGLWRFARRDVQTDASVTVIPAFGFNFAFNLPADFVRIQIVSTSPQFDPPLLQYRDSNNFLYANATPLYVAYVSNDPQYGLNIGAWPEYFVDYVSLRLARQSCVRLTNDKELKETIKKDEDKARRTAKAECAMDDPPGSPPVSFWARARRGAFGPGGLWFGSGGSGDR